MTSVTLPLRTLWESRTLVRHMTVSDMKSAHSRTVLGYLWWVLDPILMTLVYTILVGYILERGKAHPPYPLFLMCGLIAWKGFATSILQSIKLVAKNEALITAFRFPRSTLPVSMVFANQAFFLVAMGPLLGLALLYDVGFNHPNVNLRPEAFLFLPLVFITQVVLTLGFAVLAACIGVFFRDLGNILRHTIRVLWYASPGIYAVVDVIKDYDGLLSVDFTRIEDFFVLNPFVHIIEGYRAIFMKGQMPDLAGLGATFLFAITVFLFSLRVFQRNEARFVKYV